jgi:hypothetical protein
LADEKDQYQNELKKLKTIIEDVAYYCKANIITANDPNAAESKIPHQKKSAIDLMEYIQETLKFTFNQSNHVMAANDSLLFKIASTKKDFATMGNFFLKDLRLHSEDYTKMQNSLEEVFPIKKKSRH